MGTVSCLFAGIFNDFWKFYKFSPKNPHPIKYYMIIYAILLCMIISVSLMVHTILTHKTILGDPEAEVLEIYPTAIIKVKLRCG